MKKEKTFTTSGIIFLLTLATYFFADTIDATIGRSFEAVAQVTRPSASAPVAPQTQRTMADYASILERGLFGDGTGTVNGPGAAAVSFAYRLIGTIRSKSFSGAVLDDGAGMQGLYLLYQKLPDDSQLVNVWRDRISLKGPDGIVRELQVVDDSRIVDSSKPTALPQATPKDIKDMVPGNAPALQEAAPDASSQGKGRDRRKPRSRRDTTSSED